MIYELKPGLINVLCLYIKYIQGYMDLLHELRVWLLHRLICYSVTF